MPSAMCMVEDEGGKLSCLMMRAVVICVPCFVSKDDIAFLQLKSLGSLFFQCFPAPDICGVVCCVVKI